MSWEFRSDGYCEWMPAEVPGCVHLDLLRNGKIADPYYGTNELGLQWIEKRDWEYRAKFSLPVEFYENEKIEICADGLDTVAEVFLNGHLIGSSANMFVRKRWEVKKYLAPGENDIRIHFGSALKYIESNHTGFVAPMENMDPVGNSVRIRKQASQFGWDWAPRLVTCGIWRTLSLRSWSRFSLRDVQVDQSHGKGEVWLTVRPLYSGTIRNPRFTCIVEHEGKIVAQEDAVRGAKLRLKIPSPSLWWPRGMGSQPLYKVRLLVYDKEGNGIGEKVKTIGLRTIRLDQSADKKGRKFQFVVNGKPIFVKGANWIPADCFVSRVGEREYERLLRSAIRANMNCIRVWGGGVYEDETFYDFCDKNGLLVWQDFMFACRLVPGDKKFLALVKEEAEFQVARLRHHACLALWCGNNEVHQLNQRHLNENNHWQKSYRKLFHELLPSVVEKGASGTDYLPSSPWRGVFKGGHELGVKCGDTHFWEVWHARKPAKEYEKWNFRFCSEFGMQSYSSPATNQTFGPKDSNLFGPVMENHQKNPAGNQIILDYVFRRYRYPKSQDDLIWLSQLNQAYIMKIAVEHYRRNMPHCMGTIYWQLNDCWPVASWSSLEYEGRWKLAHYEIKRLYAPSIVSAHVMGDESRGIGNYLLSTVDQVHLYTVSDALETKRAVLQWWIYHLDGSILSGSSKKVILRYGESILQKKLSLNKLLSRYGRENLYVRTVLSVDERIISEQTALLTSPRMMELPVGKVAVSVKKVSSHAYDIHFLSGVFQHAFCFALKELDYAADDNCFDLYPNIPRLVRINLSKPTTIGSIRAGLTFKSLVDSY